MFACDKVTKEASDLCRFRSDKVVQGCSKGQQGRGGPSDRYYSLGDFQNSVNPKSAPGDFYVRILRRSTGAADSAGHVQVGRYRFFPLP